MMGKVQKEMGEMGNLIAYYSREGNNYVDGSIVNLPIGNTEVAAKMIQKLTGGDTFRIDTVEYDFSSKTIIPFCTNEGSGMGHSESDIRKLCSDAKVLKGLPIIGGSVRRAESDISAWLRKSGVID